MNLHEMETVSGGKIPSDSVYYEMLIHLVRKYYDKLSQFMALHMIEQELGFFHYTRKEVKEVLFAPLPRPCWPTSAPARWCSAT